MRHALKACLSEDEDEEDESEEVEEVENKTVETEGFSVSASKSKLNQDN
jgi:hypothetical protein